MTHNILQIINYGQIPRKVDEIYGDCENYEMDLWHYDAENFCQDCKSFVCDYCIKNDKSKCGVCTTIKNNYCNICKCKIHSIYCNKCSNSIYYCNMSCDNNNATFSTSSLKIFCSQKCAK